MRLIDHISYINTSGCRWTESECESQCFRSSFSFQSPCTGCVFILPPKVQLSNIIVFVCLCLDPTVALRNTCKQTKDTPRFVCVFGCVVSICITCVVKLMKMFFCMCILSVCVFFSCSVLSSQGHRRIMSVDSVCWDVHCLWRICAHVVGVLCVSTLTSVCTMLTRCDLSSRMQLKMSTTPSFSAMSNMMSTAMKQPVLPAPALNRQTSHS